jgi:hypothetical protein
MINWKGSGRKWLWHIAGIIPTFAWMDQGQTWPPEYNAGMLFIKL